MSQRLSKFVFVEPPRTALNRYEKDTILAQRRAFNILHTASLNPEWKSIEECLTVDKADLNQIYVLYEFIGDLFNHLNRLKCRVIGPLVILQSYNYKLRFPVRNIPIWAQSLQGKRINAVSFNVDDEIEIQDKVLKLGGIYKKSIDETSIVIVGVYNPDDAWFQNATKKHILVLKKEWLNKVYDAAIQLDIDKDLFFTSNFINRFRVSIFEPVSELQECPFECSVLENLDHALAEFSMIDQHILSQREMSSVHSSVPLNVMPEEPIQEARLPVRKQSDNFERNKSIIREARVIPSPVSREARLPVRKQSDNLGENTSIIREARVMPEEPIQEARLPVRKHSDNFERNTSIIREETRQPQMSIAQEELSPVTKENRPSFNLSSSSRKNPFRKQASTTNPLTENSSLNSRVPPSRPFGSNLLSGNTILENNRKPIENVREPSLQYRVSQGPVLSGPNSSPLSQKPPITWEDRHNNTSQMDSRFLANHTQGNFNQFIGQDSTASYNLFFDEEEQRILDELYKNR